MCVRLLDHTTLIPRVWLPESHFIRIKLQGQHCLLSRILTVG